MAKIACCHNCVFSYWDREHTLSCMSVGLVNWPACANRPGSLGRMQRTPARGICTNYRPRPETPQGESVRTIPLGDGFCAYVDAADFEWLSQWIWSLYGGYAGRYEKKKFILMHREIVQPPKGMIVDHKNRNKLDNTRPNLRVCTHSENAHNRAKRRGSSSRFLGVCYVKEQAKYHAYVHCRRRHLRCGDFTDEVEAARAHDRKAVEVYGEFARLNFPDEWPPERRAQVYALRHAEGVEPKNAKRNAPRTKRKTPAAKRVTNPKPATSHRSRSTASKKSRAETPGRRSHNHETEPKRVTGRGSRAKVPKVRIAAAKGRQR